MRHPLPQLDRLFLTDGGVETDLIFNRGIDLPFFASVMLLRTPEGEKALDDYIRPYLDLARRLGTGFEFVTASWRASPDWAAKFASLRRSSTSSIGLRWKRPGRFRPITATFRASSAAASAPAATDMTPATS